MLKRFWIWIVPLALIAAGCQGGVSQLPGTASPAAETAVTSATEAVETAPVVTVPAQASQTETVATGPATCTVVSAQPTPGPTEQSLFPEVSETDWVKGPDSAYVTILEYSDFMCPGCQGLAPVLDQIQSDNSEDVRVVYRHFPLISIHDKAALAAQAADAAGQQGKFWEMHDLLFEQQAEWSEMTPEDFQTWVEERAAELELDGEQFTADMTSPEAEAMSQKAWEDGQAVGMPGTPILLFNGKYYNGPLSYGNIQSIVDLILMERKQFTECPEMTIDPSKQYIATLHTEKGDIVVELFPDKAPMAVNSFVFLAQNGWFDNVTFHRVLPGYIAQGGDPSGTGYGGPGYNFDNEISDLKFDRAGLFAMANAGPGTNGSQFFITFAPAANLDGGYTIFGELIEGMDVAESLAPRDPSQDPSLPPGDLIETVTIEEK